MMGEWRSYRQAGRRGERAVVGRATAAAGGQTGSGRATAKQGGEEREQWLAEPPRQHVVKRAVAEPPPSRAEKEQRLAEPPRAQEGRWTVAEPPFKHWWKGTGPETDHKNRGTATGGKEGRGREADRDSRDRREADRDSRAGVCNGRCGKAAIRGPKVASMEIECSSSSLMSLQEKGKVVMDLTTGASAPTPIPEEKTSNSQQQQQQPQHKQQQKNKRETEEEMQCESGERKW